MDASLMAFVASSAITGFFLPFVLLGSSRGGALRTPVLLDELVDAAMALPILREWARREEYGRRRVECLSEMPQFLDILTLGLTAGLSFDASLELYCEGFDNSLARMFGEAMTTWRVGLDSRAGSLESLAEGMEIQALSSFAAVVTEALEFGTPLSSALERQAEGIRDDQRAQIEESIEKVPVKMLIPMGTLIVPAMLLAILGPLLGSAISFG